MAGGHRRLATSCVQPVLLEGLSELWLLSEPEALSGLSDKNKTCFEKLAGLLDALHHFSGLCTLAPGFSASSQTYGAALHLRSKFLREDLGDNSDLLTAGARLIGPHLSAPRE